MFVSIPSRDDPGDVDRTLLLLTSHHIETKAFRRLKGQGEGGKVKREEGEGRDGRERVGENLTY